MDYKKLRESNEFSPDFVDLLEQCTNLSEEDKQWGLDYVRRTRHLAKNNNLYDREEDFGLLPPLPKYYNEFSNLGNVDSRKAELRYETLKARSQALSIAHGGPGGMPDWSMWKNPRYKKKEDISDGIELHSMTSDSKEEKKEAGKGEVSKGSTESSKIVELTKRMDSLQALIVSKEKERKEREENEEENVELYRNSLHPEEFRKATGKRLSDFREGTMFKIVRGRLIEWNERKRESKDRDNRDNKKKWYSPSPRSSPSRSPGRSAERAQSPRRSATNNRRKLRFTYVPYQKTGTRNESSMSRPSRKFTKDRKAGQEERKRYVDVDKKGKRTRYRTLACSNCSKTDHLYTECPIKKEKDRTRFLSMELEEEEQIVEVFRDYDGEEEIVEYMEEVEPGEESVEDESLGVVTLHDNNE